MPACDPQSPSLALPDVRTHSNLTLSKRGTRTSLTFRKIRHEPCRCGEDLNLMSHYREYLTDLWRHQCFSWTWVSLSLSPAFPSACDSQGAPSTSPPSPPSLPRCHDDAAQLEEEYVHRVYDAIASHFSSTRHSPWPRVCHFLSSLPPGSVLADVGCGNGKYLGVNTEVIAVSITIMCVIWRCFSDPCGEIKGKIAHFFRTVSKPAAA